MKDERRVLVGVIGRPHGVRGLVHVTSYTEDPASIARYGLLEDQKGERYRLEWVGEGRARVSVISGEGERRIADRGAAARLTNRRLYVRRGALPAPDEDEFYLADLVGLDAFDGQGRKLGQVSAVHDYGAGASLEIGTLLVPFTRASVPEVDVAGGRVVVVPPGSVEGEPKEDDS
jgi:16S rRNA processing protein RimM